MAQLSRDSAPEQAVAAARAGTMRLLLGNHVAVISALLILAFLAIGIFAPWLAPYDPNQQHPDAIRAAPVWQAGGSRAFLLGTDGLGRDLLSRIVYGARVSIALGVAVVLLTMVVGSGLGLLAGYFGGWWDTLLSRAADVLLAFPFLVLALAVMAATGPNLIALVLALAFKGWVDFYRVSRGDTMSARQADYVTAARGLGANTSHLLLREILPNIVPPIIVLSTLRMATIIIAEASLSFLGIGVPPSIPAWGTMVADGRADIAAAWWIATFPGLAILVLVLSVNLLGEGLRDALDPRMSL